MPSIAGHNWALLGSRRPSIERCMGGCMNSEIEASFFKLCENPEGLCDGRPPSDSAQVDSRPNFTSSVTWRNQWCFAPYMMLRTIYQDLNWLEDICGRKIANNILELAPLIVGRPSPGTRPACSPSNFENSIEFSSWSTEQRSTSNPDGWVYTPRQSRLGTALRPVFGSIFKSALDF